MDCELRVTVSQPGVDPVTRTLRCPAEPPPDPGNPPQDPGDHPNAAAACAALAAFGPADDPFAPVPPGTIATMIYGGPETATVTGRWRGRPVHAELNRTNGAEIARWERLAPLLRV
ncbi:MAG TPA: SSI family serine proteinase inhibitor [Mycobacteriales bacterium]|nr:SSI family serine proteinase inhibitor [Mycobacteriales bacterium]